MAPLESPLRRGFMGPVFRGSCTSAKREGPNLKYSIFFVVAMYLLATVAFGVKHYFGHPEQGLFDAVAGGLAWPGALVEMARSPGL